MANLRVVEVKVSDSISISARFNGKLDSLSTGNVSLSCQQWGIPVPEILQVEILDDVLYITTQPLTPYSQYFLTFQSTSTHPFRSLDSKYLLEDGSTNVILILGAEDPADPIRPALLSYLDNNSVYNPEPGTLIRDTINVQAQTLSRALYDIGQIKNDNYLSILIEDEEHTRGAGPIDRLKEEGAYEVVRVGLSPAKTVLDKTISFNEFPSGPISLQTESNSELLTIGHSGAGTFEGLLLRVSKRPVVQVASVIIEYSNGDIYTYPLDELGYQIQDSRYDQRYASSYALLNDNEVKLSEVALDNPNFRLPTADDDIKIVYSYKKLGRVVDAETVEVHQLITSLREVAPPIKTLFSLQHSPIVSSVDEIVSSGGVTFLDPQSNPPFSESHPAFLKELPFKFSGLPSYPGEYAVDYEAGQVYVYGAVTNDGTGEYPPVCTYQYRKTYSSRLDYTYDPTTSEMAASPLRDLEGQEAQIVFSYQDTLVPNIDFIPEVHTEVLNERVENRLLSTNSLQVLQTPITNVFRILNETNQEIYQIQRWNNNTVFFSSNIPPTVADVTRERAAFTDVTNEVLLIDQQIVNTFGQNIVRVSLVNQNIINSSEDGLGASFNSSVSFNRTDLFQLEIYYDGQTEDLSENLDRITTGQYLINYVDGLIYLAVASDQGRDLGTVNYKKSTITTVNKHIIAVSQIYQSLDISSGYNKIISYSNVTDNTVAPAVLSLSDERFLNNDTSLPYLVSESTITVGDDIREVRGVYDHYNLTNFAAPVNFAVGASFEANVITLVPVTQVVPATVTSGLIITLENTSPGAEVAGVTSVRRISDNMELWDESGTYVGYNLFLSGINGSAPGDEVEVTYTLILNGSATPIVDYNRGDYYIDYTYLQDEILVSYEYGDNCLDFRTSSALDTGDTYYVTYKAGALRSALLKNFGTLVNIPILNNFDTSLERERYRESLIAAMQSFTKGPTLPSMKLLVSTITHIDPEIVEAAFKAWFLGISHLYPSAIELRGNPTLATGKFDSGIYFAQTGDAAVLPANNNLRLEEGTFQTWVIPDWDGLDNDASLTFSLQRNDETLSSSSIFIGSASANPTYDLDNKFTLSKSGNINPIGLPSAVYTQTGAFIYYDDDIKKWKLLVKEKTVDGYVYNGTISTSGEMYQSSMIPGLGEINDWIRTTPSTIKFELHIDSYDILSPDGYEDGYSAEDGYTPGPGYQAGYSFDGFSWMSDNPHYILDIGQADQLEQNRLSLFKDGLGYLVFRIWDKGSKNGKNKREISTNIADWAAGEMHQVAISWKLNSKDHRDEMHLFVDGQEVPNILKYGGRPVAASIDRFRTAVPEILSGTVPNVIKGDIDLQTEAGSTLVTSTSVNFQSLGVVAGHSILILENGFTEYTILSVSGHSLILDGPMPATFSDARFTVNPFTFITTTEIDLYPNIAVSVISGSEETEIPGPRADFPSYVLGKNSFNQNIITIYSDAQVGDRISVRSLGMNFQRVRERQYFWGDSNAVLKTQLPPPIDLDEVKITAVLLPMTLIGPNNATFGAGVFTATGLETSQPTSNTEGRHLSVRLTSGNTTFSTPSSVTIFGTTASGSVSETLIFSAAQTQNTSEKFKTITSVTAVVKPLVSTKNAAGIEIKELYSITESDGNESYPIVKFSYQVQNSNSLSGTSGSTTIEDAESVFVDSLVGQSLVISSPVTVAGNYTIVSRPSNTSLEVSPVLPDSFTDGVYSIYQTTSGRRGFQNGFFYLQEVTSINSPYPLPSGWYEFDYSIYLQIPLDPISQSQIFLGSSLEGDCPTQGILDEIRILSTSLSDTRIGETLADHEDSITADYSRLNPFVKNSNTLLLIHADNLPLENDTDYWVSHIRQYLQSGSSVNANFSKSLVIQDAPLVLDNAGIFSTSKEGTIEFWVSPQFDTYNDPVDRFYFDASASVVEELTSLSRINVKTAGSISSVLSVRLLTDKDNNGPDYYLGGSLSSDFKTIRLGRALPSQTTPVKVNYVPAGLSGDRISIFKNKEGFLIFNVRIKGEDYQVQQPILWERDSWHRVMATYKFNSSNNRDQLRLFIDGEEQGYVLFGSGLIFGGGAVFGQELAGGANSNLITDLNFHDPINQIYIGSDYLRSHLARARLDNLRLSNLARFPTLVAGQAKDVNYNSNISSVYPVVEDLFTTYLLDFDTLITKNQDFSLLRDPNFGIFNFDINVIDSFEIVSSNPKVKQILETLVNILKPAQSKVALNYFA